VAELSLALAREFPEDVYTLLSDQPFELPDGAPTNLTPGPANPDRRWWLRGVRKAIGAVGAEVFHGTNFEVPYLGSTPAVMTIHDLSPWRNPDWGNPKWHAAAARVRQRTPWLLRLGRARIVLTVSEAVRREVVAYFRFPEDKVRAVPLAASRAFAPAVTAAWPRPFLLFVGTLEPRKNVAGLVEAWEATRAETGLDLAIAGRLRSDFPLPSEFTKSGEREGLRFLGEVPESDLPALYSQALAFVYPSHYEGFGLPVLEAMQCGCPVITSKDPAINEVAGGAALQAGTALELADALRSVARNADLREELRRAGLARAKCFSWERTARATRDVYREALT
jgi:glycosyltransferase involved in cell wall biosynthesis